MLGPGDSGMRKRCGLMELVSATKGDDSVNLESLGTFYFVSDLDSLFEVTWIFKTRHVKVPCPGHYRVFWGSGAIFRP